MKIHVIIPLSKGYTAEHYDPDTKELTMTGHSARINAVNNILNKIPANRQFQIIWDYDEVKK